MDKNFQTPDFIIKSGVWKFYKALKQGGGNTNSFINDLILYYRDYQDAAETDILRTLDDLKAVDEAAYEDWKEIMDYWSYVNTDMTVNLGVAPDGLPEDDR